MDTIRLYSSLGGSDGILKTSAQIDRAAVGENYRKDTGNFDARHFVGMVFGRSM